MKQSSIYLGLLAGICLLSTTAAHAATLATYNFNSDTLANSVVTTGYTVSSLSFPAATVGTSSVSYGANGTGNRKLLFANTDWEETAALSITAGQFLTFTMDADSGNTLTLTVAIARSLENQLGSSPTGCLCRDERGHNLHPSSDLLKRRQFNSACFRSRRSHQ